MFPFPSITAIEYQDYTWWTELTGEPPETKVYKPRTRAHQEMGPFEQGKLSLITEPTRIDWRYEVVDSEELTSEMLPTIGSFPDIKGNFTQPMRQWLELDTCPSIQRLAFGAILLQSVKNRQSGYSLLSNYLPNIRLDPDGSSDFMYQINRPRFSNLGIEGLSINRLTKWSVLTIKSGIVKPEKLFLDRIPIEEHFACRLELDINTFQDFDKGFLREQLPLVFSELVELGEEITVNGDIQ